MITNRKCHLTKNIWYVVHTRMIDRHMGSSWHNAIHILDVWFVLYSIIIHCFHRQFLDFQHQYPIVIEDLSIDAWLLFSFSASADRYTCEVVYSNVTNCDCLNGFIRRNIFHHFQDLCGWDHRRANFCLPLQMPEKYNDYFSKVPWHVNNKSRERNKTDDIL